MATELDFKMVAELDFKMADDACDIATIFFFNISTLLLTMAMVLVFFLNSL